MATILLADDAAFQRARTAKVLLENGFNVEEADNGATAVQKYKLVRPDLVLMDITMPEMDGIQATREIRATDPNARIVMVSALGQQSMVMEAIKAGARDFIIKPAPPDQLLEAVKRHVQGG